MSEKLLYTLKHKQVDRSAGAKGGTTVNITCPFCGHTVLAYVRSLAARGKKCKCGATHYKDGSTKQRLTEKEAARFKSAVQIIPADPEAGESVIAEPMTAQMIEAAAAEQAREYHGEMIKSLTLIDELQLALAKVVYMSRDKEIEGKPFFAWLGHESFASYCAAPRIAGGLGISEKHAQKLFRVWERFVVKGGMEPKQVAQAPTNKLIRLLPVAGKTDDPGELQEMVDVAVGNSESDMISFICEKEGKKDRPVGDRKPKPSPKKIELQVLDIKSAKDYEDGGAIWAKIVEKSPCCITGSPQADAAHCFISKGAGKGEVANWVWPIRHDLHTGLEHSKGQRAFWRSYKNHVARFLHRVLFAALARAARMEQANFEVEKKLAELTADKKQALFNLSKTRTETARERTRLEKENFALHERLSAAKEKIKELRRAAK